MWSFIEQIGRSVPDGKAQEARIVAGALWALAVCTAVGMVFNLAAEPNVATLMGYLPVLVGIAVSIGFARRGWVGVAAHVIVLLSFLAVNGAALFTGGLAGGALHVNSIVVVLAAMILPTRSVAGLTILTMATLLAFALGHEWVQSMQLMEPEPLSVVIAPILNAGFLVIVVRFVRSLYLGSIARLEEQGRALDEALQELARTTVSKEHLDDVLGAVRDLILVTDAEGSIVDANPAARQELEGEQRSLLGRDIEALLPGLSEGGDVQTATIERGDGRPMPVRVSRGRLSAKSGGGGSVVVLSDITVEQAAMGTIRRAHEQAETANAAKSQFLATMSHELRSPLNAIIGYAELIGEELPERYDAQVADLRHIRNAGQDLLTLINGVLDLSKIEAGKMELHVTNVDLAPLVDQVVHIVRPRAERKGLVLTVHAAPHAMQAVRLDAQKVRQILLNLLSNATKFTERGTIGLNYERVDRQGTPWVRFTVTDTGIGITAAQRQRIFEPFSQADEGGARAFEGTGLGLSIARAFARMMGGEIHVDSRLGEGSTFRVDLPVAPG